jgi:hypothetical protein
MHTEINISEDRLHVSSLIIHSSGSNEYSFRFVRRSSADGSLISNSSEIVGITLSGLERIVKLISEAVRDEKHNLRKHQNKDIDENKEDRIDNLVITPDMFD